MNVEKRTARFWTHMDRSGECWVWAGARQGKGYGAVRWDGRYLLTHRVAWELTYGPIPPAMCVCHHCDNPPCCNPAHLFLGTLADNTADKVAKNRQARGERAAAAVLTSDQVRTIRARYVAGGRGIGNRLAREYGVTRGTISHIMRGRVWRHVDAA